MIKNKSALIFFVLDLGLIILASVLAFALRFDAQIPEARLDNLFIFALFALVTTPAVFYLFNLYKLSWSYLSLTDIPIIIKGVGVSTLFLGTILYISRNHPLFIEFPRSIIFLYGILLFFLVSALRFSKRIYWQLIRSRTGVSKPKGGQILPLTSKTLNGDKPKNILITGGAGYIGSVLSGELLKQGYNVKVVDKLLFGSEPIKELFNDPNFQFIRGDILNSEEMSKALFDVDAVVNLAAIVGEPACLSKKDLALQTNYLGAVYLARLAKTLGIKRFVQASTCSTYGQQENNNHVPEPARLFPVDFYGETKIYTERELLKLMDSNFNPTILRFSTVYGLSPRMRFDLVVNTLTKKAVKDKEIFIFGGDQWRPLIHVKDVVRSIILALEAPLSKVGSQIFNVGSNAENYLVSQVGEIVKEHIPNVEIKTIQGVEDKRSYKVDFSKIEKTLGFRNEKRVKDGVIEIRDAILSNQFLDLENKIYYNHLV
jgi:nucleoside-diphosphate-sugar epimerase